MVQWFIDLGVDIIIQQLHIHLVNVFRHPNTLSVQFGEVTAGPLTTNRPEQDPLQLGNISVLWFKHLQGYYDIHQYTLYQDIPYLGVYENGP